MTSDAEFNTNGRRPRGRPRLRSDEGKSDAILRAAALLFTQRGYAGTTMSDVAATARMSLQTVYRLYAGKIDLFAAVVALHRRSMIALPGDFDDLPVEEALARIFLIDIDADAERERQALMEIFITEMRQFPELQPIFMREGAERANDLLTQWLECQDQRGLLNVPDAPTTAKLLLDVVFGAASLKMSTAPEWPGGADRPLYLRRCFKLLADGLRPRPV